MPPEAEDFGMTVLEGVLWGALLAVALVLFVRSPTGTRWTWGLIVAGLATIVVDKAFDVHALLHALGTWIATSVDPVHHLRAPNAFHRNAALVVLFVLALVAVVWLLRHDADVGRAKVSCLAGLVVIGALLAARVAPGVSEFLSDWIVKVIELVAWLLVLRGEWLAFRRPPQRRLVDGFL